MPDILFEEFCSCNLMSESKLIKLNTMKYRERDSGPTWMVLVVFTPIQVRNSARDSRIE